ncbi:MAG: hypothetical protein HY368_00195 [Candidatus Aenigmarchaeota archaeon]|nr:hypothetical protein [Candidatus Aenigmarchaeota archaeon]
MARIVVRPIELFREIVERNPEHPKLKAMSEGELKKNPKMRYVGSADMGLEEFTSLLRRMGYNSFSFANYPVIGFAYRLLGYGSGEDLSEAKAHWDAIGDLYRELQRHLKGWYVLEGAKESDTGVHWTVHGNEPTPREVLQRRWIRKGGQKRKPLAERWNELMQHLKSGKGDYDKGTEGFLRDLEEAGVPVLKTYEGNSGRNGLWLPP